MRFLAVILVFLAFGFGFLQALQADSILWWGIAFVFALLSLFGLYDLLQSHHSLLKNYPLIGHFRFMSEDIRHQIRQYFITADLDGTPFNREQRDMVYRRAKGVSDKIPFGTQLNVYKEQYGWLNHSLAPVSPEVVRTRVRVGDGRCAKPYDMSLFNISAMSFGSLSGNAIHALSSGAAKGGFAHNTGEGGISQHHIAGGADIIWQIGTGYFGCRKADGSFCAETFTKNALLDQVKMIEIKLSQGAKPGHGGILPGEKVTPEIAAARGVTVGKTVNSPATHSAFDGPTGLLAFVSTLRDLSGGKPVGFKLCLGAPEEFLSLVKAMLESGNLPDFITIDGAEGGTGAAPPEFSNRVGTPLVDGLAFVHNALIGAGLRDKIRLAASGKIISAYDIARMIALGADWCNSARGFMFALGCIQSQRCHDNQCPTGIATQDKKREWALKVPTKAERIARYHHRTVETFAELLAAAGHEEPDQLRENSFRQRSADGVPARGETEAFKLLPGELLAGTGNQVYREAWDHASADRFR